MIRKKPGEDHLAFLKRLEKAEHEERIAAAEARGPVVRERRVRPEGWREQAIKDGVIADPDNPAPQPIYSAETHVVTPPLATLASSGEEQ